MMNPIGGVNMNDNESHHSQTNPRTDFSEIMALLRMMAQNRHGMFSFTATFPHPSIQQARPLLPDAPIFDGDKKQFPVWLDKIRGKLDGDAAAYQTKALQCEYIYSRTSSTVAQRILKIMEEFRKNTSYDTEKLLRVLSH